MEENIKGNLYTAEDVLEFQYNMCNRCDNITCIKKETQIGLFNDRLKEIKNKKIDNIENETGIRI